MPPRKEGAIAESAIPQETPRILRTYDLSVLEREIRKVSLLSVGNLCPYLKSEITFEEVPIERLLPCAKYVLRHNLEVQRGLKTAFGRVGINPIRLRNDMTAIRYNWGGKEEVLVPPIVEVSADDNDAWVLTDGAHRVINAISDGEEIVNAIVIRNSALPLAVLPVGWDEVRVVDQVPSLANKRRLRFERAEKALAWFGLSTENLERSLTAIEDPDKFGYQFFFRNLGFDGLPESDQELFMSVDECRRRYSAAGILVTSYDGKRVLLGNHKEAPSLWGNFGGSREEGEFEPEVTAGRELYEELGLAIDPYKVLGDPLIVIDSCRSREDPKVGFIWYLPVDMNTDFVLPETSEIAEVEWFTWSGVCELMDEHRPDLRLWGGSYTENLLYEWTRNYGQRCKDGGIVRQNFGCLGSTPYEKIKGKAHGPF